MTSEIDKLLTRYKSHKAQLVLKTADIALGFFEESFAQQGFTDVNLAPWAKRVQNTGQPLLTGRGDLKKSLKVRSADATRAIISTTDLPYAAIQNDGGRIRITPKMRRFFWAMYYQALGGSQSEGHKGKGHATHKGKGHAAKGKHAAHSSHTGHTRAHADAPSLSETAQFYKNLAITTEEFITIPRRQFMGHSAVLEAKLTAFITDDLTKLLNK